MIPNPQPSFIAFAGSRQIASGDLLYVALKAQAATQADCPEAVLIFEDATSRVVELDLRGTPEELTERLAVQAPAPSGTAPPDEQAPPGNPLRKPGRPKLGVVPREITLLPRHWDWLATQPGGASVALRKLVEVARRANQDKDRLRLAREAAYRFLSAMAGNEPGFEEASRALFAGNLERFEKHVESWPIDVGNYAKRLAACAFEAEDPRPSEG